MCAQANILPTRSVPVKYKEDITEWFSDFDANLFDILLETGISSEFRDCFKPILADYGLRKRKSR
jgi:hypothetical protein